MDQFLVAEDAPVRSMSSSSSSDSSCEVRPEETAADRDIRDKGQAALRDVQERRERAHRLTEEEAARHREEAVRQEVERRATELVRQRESRSFAEGSRMPLVMELLQQTLVLQGQQQAMMRQLMSAFADTAQCVWCKSRTSWGFLIRFIVYHPKNLVLIIKAPTLAV